MRRRDFAFLLPAGAFAQRAASTPVGTDLILKAMKEEMARSRPLGIAGGQPIYFMECAIDDARSFSASASLGALFSARGQAFRVPRAAIRVGDKKFDNTNYTFSELFLGSRFDPDQFPLDSNIQAMRQVLWLAFDRAYKTAIEAIGRKRAALRNITQSEELPDFSDAAPLKMINPIPNFELDEEGWKTKVTRLSKIFAAYPEVYTSSVEFEASRDVYYYANSEETEIRYTELMAHVRVSATAQAADGMRVRDSYTFVAADAAKLAGESELERGTRAIADNVRALTKAAPGESYSGPVLFESLAAAQLFADLVGSQTAATRKPVAEPGRPINLPAGEFEGRTNSRVLPASFTVVDDPTQKEYKGRPLMGHFPADLEGVASQPVVLVEKGQFKNLMATRIPTRETTKSNGHARLPGSFGGYVAQMSNLFVKAEDGVAPAELKQKFLDLVKQRNKPYGMLIRKLDYPSTASFDEIRSLMSGASSRPAALPLLAYKVFPDGREELVRGLRFRALNARALKDITASGTDETQFDFIGNGAPFAIVGGGSYVFGCSVVAPSLLFEDLELERPQVELPKLPVVPAPPLTA